MTQLQVVPQSEFAAAVLAGLAGSPPSLPCRFFYDREGSRLFDEICELPEYYLTRAEDALLREAAAEIARSVTPESDLVELGSGSATKTRRLISALLETAPELRYYPVDISGEMLRETARALSSEFPRLSVYPLAGEYAQALGELPRTQRGPKLVLFLGSNLGNFRPREAEAFLGRIRATMGPGDFALLGLDLRKPREVLHAAYNDSRGVTARFNLNLLRRINRELQGDFELSGWEHQAVVREDCGCVQMRLVCRKPQEVCLAGQRFRFEAGDYIHTEDSHKYSREQIASLADAADFRVSRTWQDERAYFSLNLFAPI
ncbi:MAG: L-histidine N(alpha)-methyltransferase [Armatimonadota bacterium]